MKKWLAILIILALSLALLPAACGGDDDDDDIWPTPTVTPTPTPTPTPTLTPTPTPTPMPTPTVTPTSPATPAVTFPDPNLEAAVREAIGKPAGAIHQSDLEEVEVLNCVSRGIRDLSGLEHFPFLRALDVRNNKIADISPLADLYFLRDAQLDHNKITNIGPLSRLKFLQSLSLANNWVTDISPLSDLTFLEEVLIYGNLITDISPLSELTNPRRLWLNDNMITDIAPLVQNSGLGRGDEVTLMDNPLSTRSVSVHIPELQRRGVRVWHGHPPPTPTPTPTPSLGVTPPPCRFYGTVRINGVLPAEFVTTITATIEGQTYTTTTPSAVYGASTYAIQIAEPEGMAFDGKTVTFKIGDLDAAQAGAWEMGGNVWLDLTATF